jgi:hypothetical protein
MLLSMERTNDLEVLLTSNVGRKERAARFIVSFLLLVAAMLGTAVEPSAVFTVFAVVLFVTAWFRFCPVAALLGRGSGPEAE